MWQQFETRNKPKLAAFPVAISVWQLKYKLKFLRTYPTSFGTSHFVAMYFWPLWKVRFPPECECERRNALFHFRLHAKCLWQIDKLLLYYTLADTISVHCMFVCVCARTVHCALVHTASIKPYNLVTSLLFFWKLHIAIIVYTLHCGSTNLTHI